VTEFDKRAESVFKQVASGAKNGRAAVVACQTSSFLMDSDGVVGFAATWTEARHLLHRRGYKILRKDGLVEPLPEDFQPPKSQHRNAVLVTVCPLRT